MKKLVLLALAWSLAGVAFAQFPSKPIRAVVPFGAGSSTDIVMRIIAVPLGQALGQPIVVDNKPGADGVIAAVEVMKAPADGHTFLLATNSPLSAAPHLKKSLPYNPMEFTPLSFVGNYTFFIIVHPSVPAKSVAELIAYAKANPGKLNYATGNTTSIVTTAMFATMAGINLQHIPYKTEPPAITDLLSGQVHMMVSSFSPVAAQIREGKLRPLVTTLPERSALLPDVPSIVEAGFPKFPIVPWAAVVGPAKMPKDVVDRLNREINAVLKRPEVRENLAKQAFAGRGSTPEELQAHMKDQLEVWGKAVRDAGIQPD